MTLTWKLNDDYLGGSALRGKGFATYDRLVEIFGEPNLPASDDGKVWNEWSLQFEVGKPEDDDWDVVDVTIYDWKEPHIHVARYGKYEWHIGAKNHLGVECVYDALEI